ncbi:UbiH/UbiF family hydroxylase [Chachezhania sediminis]|uniref:UbiH/UbiF family hydroxylase n=1 Tax=Chachezhania sediminis TaxID=2599291 RepID=UPI00131C2349|nr:UbiH/UbiF family hydroxylase [Chachezhania sediminis]
MTESCDVLIVGGGIAGLAAAAAFGQAGFRVICVDPTPPVTSAEATDADRRTTAFLQPARALLDRIGLWDRLAPHASPLQIMRIVDAGGEAPAPRVVRDFDSRDLSDAPFGWNLPNWLLRREMSARLADLPSVDFRPGRAARRLFTREANAIVTLDDGARIDTKLVIAADGRRSAMRAAAGIGVRTFRYGQKALAFAVTHPEPHNNVSTEIHRTGGPFTLVPLPDLDGKPSSAVVWMERGPRALALMELEAAAFEARMTERSCGLLGPLTLASPRSVWPIISQIADRLTDERLVLMAEAAHVVPPIGAQGLNMSLADLACLLDLAAARPEGLGDRQMLDAYAKARHGDIRLRVQGIDLLNRASMAAPALMRDARAAGIAALYAAPPVRQLLMEMGLGLRRAG